ncbi:thioester domain-containing protein [Actinokineospora globicatena]|uniref:TQXA domain-containing protein n=1 Tax=Actinokineospora globicatena TaxID=103729 RepID=A0A9W6VAE9_9PSEU|nr:thioester domain-containing protein [Actinokineospora globicatena]MCP2301053.1 LPXTG-motif cell wall anchor domain-containing protein/TQXA domain-containing protein [Actinokineospora globicatena]GLW77314.1 TQXA domain-containing protein [Actinokineospora globicatena]GLW84148.1 TQXA domain-containing protein [Actinokineospora globicatena]GLW91908.1 TQXA domain-containing protein [Actinokineospora globicatena]
MRSRWKVAAATLSLAAVSASFAALPAAAAEPVKGTLQPLSEAVDGYAVNMVKGAHSQTKTPFLLDFKLTSGEHLAVYCVGIDIGWTFDNEAMTEVPWGDYPDQSAPFKANANKVNWVLHHGYPNASLAALNGLGLDTNADGIELDEAISATQAALWHFSDGYNLNPQDPVNGGGNSGDDAEKDVLALYNYLVGPANVGIGEWTAGALKINPGSLSGTAGERVGPFKVTTNGTVTALNAQLPAGVKITDDKGKVLAAADIKNDTEFYVEIPAGAAAGNGTVKLSGKSPVIELGRLFTGKHANGSNAQPLIVASSDTKNLDATAKVDWKVKPTTPPSTSTTPPTTSTTTTVPPTTTTTVAPAPQPSPGLPDTGASILVPALAGLALLGGGAAALLYVRHRRRSA